MALVQLPSSVVLFHLLDLLPLGAALLLCASAHFADISVDAFRTYVRTVQQELLAKLGPILDAGVNIPCMSFHHRPSVSFDLCLLEPDFKWVRPDGGYAEHRRNDIGDHRLWRLVVAGLRLVPQRPGAFERSLQQARGTCCLRRSCCVVSVCVFHGYDEQQPSRNPLSTISFCCLRRSRCVLYVCFHTETISSNQVEILFTRCRSLYP